MTGRAIDFMDQAGDAPWLCHLSYIKPHWPYIVPAPYHAMYGAEHVLPAVRTEEERATDHPVFRAYIESRVCRTFSRDEVRERVIPAYMGLVKQIDDQMGRLFAWMEEKGLMENTMIAFTSDHGDYLGDHWMGEKDLFHDASVKVPLIVYDPREEADATRGPGARRARRVHRPRAHLPALFRRARPAAHHRGPGARPAAACGAAARVLAALRDRGIRLRHPAGARGHRQPAGGCAAADDPRRALEIHPRRGVPPDAVRPPGGPGRAARSRRERGARTRGGARPPARGAVRLGAPAPLPDHAGTGRPSSA